MLKISHQIDEKNNKIFKRKVAFYFILNYTLVSTSWLNIRPQLLDGGNKKRNSIFEKDSYTDSSARQVRVENRTISSQTEPSPGPWTDKKIRVLASPGELYY